MTHPNDVVERLQRAIDSTHLEYVASVRKDDLRAALSLIKGEGAEGWD